MNRLLTLLDNFAGPLLDDFSRYLNLLEPVLGKFGIPIALVVIVLGWVAVLAFQETIFMRRLPALRKTAEEEEANEPWLMVPADGKRKDTTSITVDPDSISIDRGGTPKRIKWSDVRGWDRNGVADWSVLVNDAWMPIQVKNSEKIDGDILRRLDRRIALHVTDQPRK